MKTIFYETNAEDRRILSELLKPHRDVEAEFVADKLTMENIRPGAEIISVFIGSEVDKAAIEALPKLKLIAARSTGFDHIDAAYAKTKGIVVCNVPAYGSRTVAEFTFGLILGLSRKIFLAYRQIKDQHDFDISHFEGFNLQHKTLGVVGTGRIGQNVIQIAKGFDMRILAFDSSPAPEKAKTLGFEYTSLDELLANADVISLHVPYNPATHHLINKNNIRGIKKGAILINTARGEVADTEAVLYGLQNKLLSAAGLDVLEGERELKQESAWAAGGAEAHGVNFRLLLEDHVLMDLPDTAITPHIAFFTKEARLEILKTTIENLAGFIQGKPSNLVEQKS